MIDKKRLRFLMNLDEWKIQTKEDDIQESKDRIMGIVRELKNVNNSSERNVKAVYNNPKKKVINSLMGYFIDEINTYSSYKI